METVLLAVGGSKKSFKDAALEDNSTCHKMNTDVMAKHMKEEENLLNNLTTANKQRVS